MSETGVTVVTVVVLVLVFLLGGAANWYFHGHVMSQKNEELDEASKALVDAQMKDRARENLREQNSNDKKLIADLQRRIPNLDRLEYDRFVNLLDEKRRRANVLVSSASWVTAKRTQPAPGRPAAGLPPSMHKVSYTLQVSGSFDQLLKFMNLLEKEQRFISVDSFSISPSAEAQQQTDRPTVLRRDMKVTLSSYTYRIKPEDLEPETPVEIRQSESTPSPE